MPKSNKNPAFCSKNKQIAQKIGTNGAQVRPGAPRCALVDQGSAQVRPGAPW